MLIETTLREGEQAYGVYFDYKTKVDIATGLALCGLEEIELGWVGQQELPRLIKEIKSLNHASRLGVWSPLRKPDIENAAVLEPDCLNIGCPVSDRHIAKRLKLDKPEALRLLAELVDYAVSLGFPLVSVGLEDATRADEDFALKAALTAVKAGADRVRLSDTVGVASPLDMARLVKRFKAAGVPCLAVHCHNDFGLATANAVTALQSGADAADVSLLGLGERAGIASTEELAANLCLRSGNIAKYDMPGLRRLCLLAAKRTGRQVAPDKPIVGENLFSCESGLHVGAMAKDASLFEPFAPEALGQGRVLSVGKKSGKSAVSWALQSLGFGCGPEDAQEATRKVREISAKLGRPLELSELACLARNIPVAADG